MTILNVFERYEIKFLLTEEQKEKILAAMTPYMELDQYGRSHILNLYYDNESYLLIRNSIEKPVYKEKLRVRSYGQATSDSTVFVELKRKYRRLVYKRRIAMEEQAAMKWLNQRVPLNAPTQISQEIDYFMDFYGNLQPTLYLSYEREAFYAKDGTDFRITFDDHIYARQDDLSLTSNIYGTSILPEGKVLMEIKCSGGIPIWLSKLLSEEQIYKTSFSKYGIAYRMLIFPQTHSTNVYDMMEVNSYE